MIAHPNSGCGVRLRLMSGPPMRRTQSLTMDFFRFGALHLDRIFDGPTPVEVDESHCQRICDFLSAVDQQHACSCANLFLQDPRAPFADCLREANSKLIGLSVRLDYCSSADQRSFSSRVLTSAHPASRAWQRGQSAECSPSRANSRQIQFFTHPCHHRMHGRYVT